MWPSLPMPRIATSKGGTFSASGLPASGMNVAAAALFCRRCMRTSRALERSLVSGTCRSSTSVTLTRPRQCRCTRQLLEEQLRRRAAGDGERRLALGLDGAGQLVGDIAGAVFRPAASRASKMRSASISRGPRTRCGRRARSARRRRSAPRCPRCRACGVSPDALQPSRIGSIQVQAASTSSRRMNSVWLPRTTSISRRS